MTNLFYARAQMGLSLAFHIIFAAIGVALPAFMATAEFLAARDPAWQDLARRWSKGTAILFAVGAVSGTVLSFELGLLWPAFMDFAGGVIGLPFAMEGFAFFTEAIFLGLYLYGRTRLPPRAHRAASVVVAVSGLASAFFVVTANAWMNTPAGFTLSGGHPTGVDPLAAMFNPSFATEALHVLGASFLATAFGVASIHAWLLRRDPQSAAAPLHRKGLSLALLVGGGCALLQPLSGDLSARRAADLEPAKFAAMEAAFVSERGAPLTIGGLADIQAGAVRGAIRIPHGLSLLATHRWNGEVAGLDRVDRALWPDVATVHASFDLMVGMGMLLLGLSGLTAFLWWRGGRKLPEGRRFLALVIAAGPAGFLGLEAGWMVTEKGRQPWIIAGVMRTADAVTPMPWVAVSFWVTALLYLALGATAAYLLRQIALESPTRDVADGAREGAE